ncbi:MAG TPA: hypothetical protein VHG92_06990 [Afifellaceae bacterium]|nr:hypothetical protein [Afifellaceae bacterium]
MNARILSLAAAAAIAIASLGATAPANSAPFGSVGQSITAPANDLLIEVGHKGKGGKKWKKFKKFKKFKHLSFYPGHYPHWCWETVYVKTKFGLIKKRVFVCH